MLQYIVVYYETIVHRTYSSIFFYIFLCLRHHYQHIVIYCMSNIYCNFLYHTGTSFNLIITAYLFHEDLQYEG